MKCPDCDAPAHPKHVAHQFKPLGSALHKRVAQDFHNHMERVLTGVNKVSHTLTGVAHKQVSHISNAAKCRKYRQAHADQYRASNRQRMAKARA